MTKKEVGRCHPTSTEGELEGTPGWRSQHQPVGDISSIRPLHSFCGREKTTLITSGSYIEVKGATEGRTSTIDDERLKEVLPGDYVYIKTFKRGWSEPRREGPFEVVLATPTAVKDQINSHHTLQQTEKQEISLQRVRAESQDLSQGASPEQRHLMTKTQLDRHQTEKIA
ncbi:hypothetical protein SRHO_G00184670 [Serrasalmus rhombeus]